MKKGSFLVFVKGWNVGKMCKFSAMKKNTIQNSSFELTLHHKKVLKM